jgi:hypothetical protein
MISLQTLVDSAGQPWTARHDFLLLFDDQRFAASRPE